MILTKVVPTKSGESYGLIDNFNNRKRREKKRKEQRKNNQSLFGLLGAEKRIVLIYGDASLLKHSKS